MNVTVVICTYNSGAYLKPSVLSVLEQTYDDYEIVVVDDGSTDGSVRELDSIRSEKLRIFHQANQGKSAALNFASKVAHGEWIVIQDADDLAHPERLSRLAAAVDGEDQLAAVFSGYDIIFNERRVAPISKTKDVAQCRADIESFRMPSHDPTMMVRTNLVRSLQFNDGFRVTQTVDFIYRLGEQYPMIMIPDVLYSYRIHYNSLTRSYPRDRHYEVLETLRQACVRRGQDFDVVFPEVKREQVLPDNGLHAHFIESVGCQKELGYLSDAFKTALASIQFQPSSLRYYRPILHASLPTRLLLALRRWRANRRRRRNC